jgi:hypothetical protein
MPLQPTFQLVVADCQESEQAEFRDLSNSHFPLYAKWDRLPRTIMVVTEQGQIGIPGEGNAELHRTPKRAVNGKFV